MRLSDIMSNFQLSIYAEVGLVLFMAAFLAIVYQVFRSDRAIEWEQARQLPLEGDDVSRVSHHSKTQPARGSQ